MKSPKPIVAGALVAGGLLFTSAAAAVTLPDEASRTAKDQVEAFLAGLPDEAKSAGDDRRSDDVDTEGTEVEKVEVEETDADETSEDEGGERPDTHGSAVSALATSDETKALDGRERGEAISTLARTNGGADTETEEAETEEAETEEAETEEVETDEDDDDADDADTEDAGSEGRQRAAKARQEK